ncbi:MAG: hypothetical protein J5700_00975, partial [Treponema sp.]|nr:hypothetical protein [Treponema sp.]
PNQKIGLEQNNFDFDSFKKQIASTAELLEKTDQLVPDECLVLPEMAYWLNQSDKNGSKKISIKDAKKLALKSILLYNKLI